MVKGTIARNCGKSVSKSNRSHSAPKGNVVKDKQPFYKELKNEGEIVITDCLD
jgi:hypothetical protein